MIDKVKNHILKYIRKYISLAVAVVALPFFTVNSFANYSLDEWYNTQSPNGVFAGMFLKSGYDSYYWKLDAKAIADGYLYTGTGGFNGQGVSMIDIFYSDSWMPILNHNNFDYYLGIYLSSVKTSSYSIEWSSDTPQLYYGNGSAGYVNGSTDNYTQYDTTLISSSLYTGSNNMTGWSYLFKLPSNFSTLGLVRFNNISGLNSNFRVGFFLYQVDKSNGDISNIVDAINNQTTQLGSQLGSIDGNIQQGNDLIENGTDETQQAVTDFNEVFEEFNTQLEEIETFETQFTDDFNAANETYLSELSQFAMPYGVINAGNWLSTSMQTIYDNSDDYKMLWLVPLLLGVPLVILFFKRGDNSE